ncbi:hypothetical protein HMPREF3034_02327 [Prevotella sp. DNF00663]|uniref:hypothetical protein n=1 Tax=unclassified Prevotella TaxID=2638335 RepID=UPI0005142C63|nr:MULTISPECIES: hypothetical protein [unclassified Prevotella]KGI59940.1 hypothetical protein HMPREF0671_08895 [Prevotella sp. S7 MS 2]KXB78880.1 hypothetical protein HMPREF3034_02327 [Prevotella sp. DNF00663]
MKRLPVLLLTCILLSFAACGGKQDDQGELAARAAKLYYDYLLHGDYDAFVAGTYRPDSLPASYQKQLADNAAMFIGQQNDEHRGIKDIRIVSGKADTAKHVAQVMMQIVYGDSTNEQIVVPMVQHKGVWYLR